MNVLDFTNRVDGLTNDFTNGATDARTFKAEILDLLIKVAKPYLGGIENINALEESPEHEFILEAYQPSKKGEGDFFTINDLVKDFLVHCQKTIIPRPEILGRCLHKLNYERVAFRKAQYPVYGYWMKKIA